MPEQEYKITDNDARTLMDVLSQVNIAKVCYCDFKRIAQQKRKELEELKTNLENELNNSDAKMLGNIEKKELAFKSAFLSIRDSVLPKDIDVANYIFDQSSQSFKLKEEEKKET